MLIKQLRAPLVSLTWDKDGLSLVLPPRRGKHGVPKLETLNESPEYRLITFDLPLDPGARRLPGAPGSGGGRSGREHLCPSPPSRVTISSSRLRISNAWEALRQFIRTCQAEEAAEA